MTERLFFFSFKRTSAQIKSHFHLHWHSLQVYSPIRIEKMIKFCGKQGCAVYCHAYSLALCPALCWAHNLSSVNALYMDGRMTDRKEQTGFRWESYRMEFL